MRVEERRMVERATVRRRAHLEDDDLVGVIVVSVFVCVCRERRCSCRMICVCVCLSVCTCVEEGR